MTFRAPFLAISLLVAAVAALLGTWVVHSVLITSEGHEAVRSANERFICDSGSCELGSGLSWLITGATLVGPFIVLFGLQWSRWLHQKDKLGPFSYRALPDGEQIVEVLAVLGAGLASYWLATRGPTIEAVEVHEPNSWISGRLDESGRDLVPTRAAWFSIGVILFAPFAFSFGSMAGREWYGRVRRRSFGEEDAENQESDLA